MTNTELKASVDSVITNETTPNSITPIEVGGVIKSVIDYIDQEIDSIVVVPSRGNAVGESMTAPYDTLNYKVNNNLSYTDVPIALPSNLKIGENIVVIQAYNSPVYASSDGSGNIVNLNGGGSSSVGYVNLLAANYYEFTFLGNDAFGDKQWMYKKLS